MNVSMIEKQLILYCSPTLAGLKSASLFSMPFYDENKLKEVEIEFQKTFSRKGLSLKWLGTKNGRILVYIYRRKKLNSELSEENVKKFLISFGYDVSDIDGCLEKLKKRILFSEEFPHEIGMFLGYPLSDVKGFIENKGQNYRFAGFWKIYANENDTLKLFEKYRHCTNEYTRLYENGRSVEKLAIRS